MLLKLFQLLLGKGKNKAFYKALLAVRRLQNFQVNQLEYSEEAMTLYGTYNAYSFKEIVDAINHLHKHLTIYEKMLGGSQPYWYRDNIIERGIGHLTLIFT